ncbi:D-serine deaminase-like pyridoxal phosphate-dependent protein [Streptomyces sp. 3330]|uniref:DSD1 family PLP-dependent enzyme n=1 Tax=Streptomyces sp. 3330 TaxID=2817755 RepID=UPI00285D83AD|nr:DSD1 family PLP-dependent enzyme [Streptomyces sp. 3330]MDR6974298.1 D-serine deaminase-like pyridoxal phosphate-dependent protein [Streptomyces sp. 3330]
MPLDLTGVPTPALLLDLDKLTANLTRMQTWSDEHGIALRPHAKTHKSPWIAAQQIASGARGICVTKLAEAEVMAHAGIRDILLTCPVPASKTSRLLDLAGLADLCVVVDSVQSVRHLNAACGRRGVVLPVLVDLEVGQGRTGVRSVRAAAELAQLCADSPHLHFRGIQGYGGHIQHIPDVEQRRVEAHRIYARVREAAQAIAALGLRVEEVSTDGTGSCEFAPESGVVTEVQPGSYAVMDAHYAGIQNIHFEKALHVLTQVVSQPEKDLAVVDTGWKAVSTEDGMPEVVHPHGATYTVAGDEHGLVRNSGDQQWILLLPSHCDTTINLYGAYHLISGGRSVGILPIPARGAVT